MTEADVQDLDRDDHAQYEDPLDPGPERQLAGDIQASLPCCWNGSPSMPAGIPGVTSLIFQGDKAGAIVARERYRLPGHRAHARGCNRLKSLQTDECHAHPSPGMTTYTHARLFLRICLTP